MEKRLADEPVLTGAGSAARAQAYPVDMVGRTESTYHTNRQADLIVQLRAHIDVVNSLVARLAADGVVMRLVPGKNYPFGGSLAVDDPEPDRVEIVLVMPRRKTEDTTQEKRFDPDRPRF